MSNALPLFLQTNEEHSKKSSVKKRHSLSFIDRTLKSIAELIKIVYFQSDTASRRGLLQQVDARVKSIFLFFFILIISLNRQISSQFFISAFFFVLIISSGVNLAFIYKKVVVLSFFFGFLVVAPAALNFITDGEIILNIVHFKKDLSFWIYHVPSVIGVTKEGCLVVLGFYMKVANSLTLTLMIVYTTPFNEIIKSLRLFRVPAMFLLVITLTYKFIFILAQTTEETYFAMKSRWWRNTRESQMDKIVAGRITHIFRKSWIKYEEIYRAMSARGYTGAVNISYSQKIKYPDIAFLVFFLAIGVLCYFI